MDGVPCLTEGWSPLVHPQFLSEFIPLLAVHTPTKTAGIYIYILIHLYILCSLQFNWQYDIIKYFITKCLETSKMFR